MGNLKVRFDCCYFRNYFLFVTLFFKHIRVYTVHPIG